MTPNETQQAGSISYTDLRAANVARQAEWDPDDRITLEYRGNELAGEVGEACNVIKKLARERLGIRGTRDTVEHLAEELADVVICADLVAMSAGIDLDAAVAAKFNATSERYGLASRYEPNAQQESEHVLSAQELLDNYDQALSNVKGFGSASKADYFRRAILERLNAASRVAELEERLAEIDAKGREGEPKLTLIPHPNISNAGALSKPPHEIINELLTYARAQAAARVAAEQKYALLNQGSGEYCESCGWNARFPDDCLKCKSDAQIVSLNSELSRAERERDEARAGNAALLAELTNLRAVVERLPKTADGVPITPDLEIWTNNTKYDVPQWLGSGGHVSLGSYRFDSPTYALDKCYSTREAAEAARSKSV